MAAVQQNWEALQYVKEQTIEMCTEAIKQNSKAWKYVKTKSDLFDRRCILEVELNERAECI